MPKIGQIPQLGVLAAVLGVGVISFHCWWRRRRGAGACKPAVTKACQKPLAAAQGPQCGAAPGTEGKAAAAQENAEGAEAIASTVQNLKQFESETSLPEVEAVPRLAEEVQAISKQALASASAYFDDAGSRWTISGKEDGVQLSNLTVPNCRLPIFRGLLDIPAEKAPDLVDVAQVMLSSSCRRFYDQYYERGVLLERCGSSTGLVCTFNKPNPVEGPTFSISACGTARNNSSDSVCERLTVASAAVPEHIMQPHASRIKELCSGDDIKPAHMRLWALDALRREDGSLRVGFLLHTDASSVKLPTFLLRKLISSAPAVPIHQIVLMASQGMTPRDTIAFTGPEPEETEERMLNGRQVRVSKLFHDVFPDDPPLVGRV
mmetsp:Transcript_24546/g.44629  ORF Transcript_24546/g.44629 Transcript_24546/m.44629 type:complete len:377 (+) Transcript_24546:22-1152(+)